MAFKMVVLFAALACASAAYLEADHQEAHHYSPASAVSYSSFTRHEPTKVAKTVTYAEPAYHYAAPVAKTVTYAQPAVHYSAPVATQAVTYAQPSVQYVHEQPTYAKTLVAAPTYAKSYVHHEPAVHYSTQAVSLAQPAVHYATPVATQAVTYAQPSYQYVREQPTYVKGPTTTNHVVSHPPALTKTLVAAPTYAKAYVHQEPAVYASNTVSYQTPLAYSAPVTKTYVSEPVYAKTVVQQPTYLKTVSAQPVYAKTLSYAPEAQVSHVSYQDASSHYTW